MTRTELEAMDDGCDDDWGCEYCRNDCRLVDGRCPKCDAEWCEDDEEFQTIFGWGGQDWIPQ